MNVTDILKQLQDERSRLDQAISALQALDFSSPMAALRRGRPPKSASAPTSGRRRMSASARAKIAAAQRARWAKQKGTTPARGSATKQTASAPAQRARRGMSPAARKRMSEMMKQRWAARKGAR